MPYLFWERNFSNQKSLISSKVFDKITLQNLINTKLHVVSAGVGGSLAEEDGAYLPVNRFFTVESPVPRPDLECLVGVDSADTSELYKVWPLLYICKM